MDNDPRQDQALEALFDTAKGNRPAPDADFMARLAADADAAVPKPETAVTPRGPSMLSRLKGVFAASGLTGAAVLGVWIGLVMPETLNTFADAFATDDTVSLGAFLPGADLAALSE